MSHTAPESDVMTTQNVTQSIVCLKPKLNRPATLAAARGSANSRGELEPAEPHPAAYEAKAWIAKLPLEELYKWREAFASCAIEGNRLGDVCAETLNRLLNSQPVSDRYLLGLAWTMRSQSWPNDQTHRSGSEAWAKGKDSNEK